jgi:hypothetical protein
LNCRRKKQVGIAEARAIALKAHRGKITDEELERETGGTGLRYSFDIKSGSSTQEVGVDARTGRVLENAKEGKKPRLMGFVFRRPPWMRRVFRARTRPILG